MKIICPTCEREVGEVTAGARLILTAHCPYDGTDFGVAVAPPELPSAEQGSDQQPAGEPVKS